MKRIFTFILLLPILATAQNHLDSSYSNSINTIFQHLDKSTVQSGILLDYGLEFTDVTAYSGTVSEDNYVDVHVLSDMYKTLFISKVVGDTVHTPLIQKYGYNWAKERFTKSITIS